MSENLTEQFAVLPGHLGHHLLITMMALVAGAALSLPLAVATRRHPRWRATLLAAVSIVQTVPGLALLALMVPLLAALSVATLAVFGFELPSLGLLPTVLALTLYSMLPMVRNTVAGLLGVGEPVRQAARAVGMTDRQMLWKVELPLAAPVILAGVRTATVWTVGIATLATPVGQRCLGNFIFSGLQTRNLTAVLFGCVAAAGLALLLDLLLGGIERGVRTRRRGLGAASAAGLGAVLLLGLTAPLLAGAWSGRPDGPPVRIGAKTFTEQYILAELLDSVLTEAGYAVDVRSGLGSTVGFDALVAGDIDVFVDYSGTLWAHHMGRDGPAGRAAVLEGVTRWLGSEHGIHCLGSLGFENAYGFAMTRPRAAALGVDALGDLARPAPGLTVGGDYEFFSRPEWRAVRDAYGLRFADEVSYDSRFMYQALAQGDVDVISAFTSDGWIVAFDLVVLDDPREALPPYDAVLLLSRQAAADPALVAALRPLVGALDVETMRTANHMVDRDDDKRTVGQAARWLEAEALGGR